MGGKRLVFLLACAACMAFLAGCASEIGAGTLKNSVESSSNSQARQTGYEEAEAAAEASAAQSPQPAKKPVETAEPSLVREEERAVLWGDIWVSEGYRLSDTEEYRFSEDGTFQATNPTGLEPWDGTYQLDGDTLRLFDREGNELDRLIYDGERFTSTVREVLAQQDYVDADGAYHELSYRVRTMERKKEEDACPEEIDGLAEIVMCYESCLNGRFCVEYDRNQALPDSFDGVDSFYRVTSPWDTVEKIREHLLESLSPELLESLWDESCFRESEGVLYYRPGNAGFLSFDPGKAELEEGGGAYRIPMYNSGDEFLGIAVFTFEQTESGIRLTTVEGT